MNRVLNAVAACAIVAGVHAEPVSPPSHPEKDLRSIGGGLWVSQDEVSEADSDGNTTMLVFSRTLIEVEEPYTLDLSELAGVPASGLVYDAGAFGLLRAQSITLDCVHRTYKVIDTHKLIPEPTWRPAATLPALAPVFRLACRRQSKPAIGASTARPAQAAAARPTLQRGVESRPPVTVVSGPSFDCTTAHSLVERLICTDGELAGLDRDLAQLYAQARALAPDIEAFRRSSYYAWQQKQICVNKPCLVAWYTDRRRQLSQLIAHDGQNRGTESPPVSSQTSQQ